MRQSGHTSYCSQSIHSGGWHPLCPTLDKSETRILEYLTEFLAAYVEQNPDDLDALIIQPQGQQGASSVSPSPTVNTWNKFQSVIGSASLATYSSSVNTTPNISVIIDMQQMYTYAAAAAGNRCTQPFHG